MRLKTSNSHSGFSHHVLLPVLAIVAVGSIGAYLTFSSRAATNVHSGNMVYEYSNKEKSRFLGSMTSDGRNNQTVEGGGIYLKESFIGNKWAMTDQYNQTDKKFYAVARSSDLKSTVSYNTVANTFFTSDCSSGASGAKYRFAESHPIPNYSSLDKPGKIVVHQTQRLCKSTDTIYNNRFLTVDPEGKNLKELYYDGRDGAKYTVLGVGSNGNIALEVTKNDDTKYYILSSNGSMKERSEQIKALSRDGKKIVSFESDPARKREQFVLTDIATGKKTRSTNGTSMNGYWNYVSDVSYDGKLIVFAKRQAIDGPKYVWTLSVYDMRKDQETRLDSATKSEDFDLCFSRVSLSTSEVYVGYVKLDSKYETYSIRRSRVDGTQRIVSKEFKYGSDRSVHLAW